MDETGIVKSYIMYHWFASQLTFLTHLFSPCNQIDAFKLTKSHKRDKNCKKTAVSGRRNLFVISLLFRLLKSPALSHILKEYPQKNLLLSFTFIFHSIDPAFETFDLCALVLRWQRITNNVSFCLQLASRVLSWLVIYPLLCLFECVCMSACMCVCTGFPNVFSSGHLSICSSSSWTSRIIGEKESHWV